MTSRPELNVKEQQTWNWHAVHARWNAVSVNPWARIGSIKLKQWSEKETKRWSLNNNSITSFAGPDPLATESRFGLLLTHKTTGWKQG